MDKVEKKLCNESTYSPQFDYRKFQIGIEEISKSAGVTVNVPTPAEVNSETFPTEVFALPIRQIIKSTNECLNFPVDFIGSSILYAASVAIGNSYRVEVMNNWTESAALYLALVGRPGTNKSHPLKFALGPLFEADKISYRDYSREMLEYEKEQSAAKRSKVVLAQEIARPTLRKMIVSDFTLEALTTAHKNNLRGLGVYADELAGWFKNFNRYNSGSEMEFWLSSWSGTPVNIDRKTGEPILIPSPFISVAGTIQNGVLKELSKGDRKANGFMDRILFAIPHNLRKEYWKDSPLDPTISLNWQLIIEKLCQLPVTLDDTLNPKPKILAFSSDAKALLLKWQRENTDSANEIEDDNETGIRSKLEIYVPRLALIMQLLLFASDSGDKDVISLDAVRAAIELAKYFFQCATVIDSAVRNANPLDHFPKDQQRLYELLPNHFKTGEGQQIAEAMGITERTYKRFITEKNLFTRLSRGEYEKTL